MPSAKRLPPGMYATGSGKYRVRFHKGESVYATKTFTRLADAKRWQADMQRAKETGRVDQADADLQTLSALAAEHMKAKRPDLAAQTYKNYRTFWAAHVRPHPIASAPLRSITVETVEDFRDDLRAGLWRWDKAADRPKRIAKADRKPVGEVSIRQTLVLVQGILERAVRLGRIQYNPVKAVMKPKTKRTSTINVIAPKSVEQIRAQMRLSDATLVSVLAYSGVRPEEARALKWDDIGARTLRVERAADLDGSIKPTKTDQMRTVKLLAPLASDLTVWRKACGSPKNSALIFPRADGTAWKETDYRNWRKRRFGAAVTDAKVNIGRPYDLRHSAVSLWLHEGVSPVQVAKWLGHRPTQTLGTYAHVVDDLDPTDRKPAEEVIGDVRIDISLTWDDVHKRPKQSKRPRKKVPTSRKKAVAA